MFGLLWYDPAGDLASRVERAAAYYRQKFGGSPGLALVNPAELPAGELSAGSIRVKPDRGIMRGHVLIGVESEDTR